MPGPDSEPELRRECMYSLAVVSLKLRSGCSACTLSLKVLPSWRFFWSFFACLLASVASGSWRSMWTHSALDRHPTKKQGKGGEPLQYFLTGPNSGLPHDYLSYLRRWALGKCPARPGIEVRNRNINYSRQSVVNHPSQASLRPYSPQ